MTENFLMQNLHIILHSEGQKSQSRNKKKNNNFIYIVPFNNKVLWRTKQAQEDNRKSNTQAKQKQDKWR